MTARTAALHTPADLRFFGCCDASDFVHYEAPSQSQPGKMNTTTLDHTRPTLQGTHVGSFGGRPPCPE